MQSIINIYYVHTIYTSFKSHLFVIYCKSNFFTHNSILLKTLAQSFRNEHQANIL